MRYMSIWLYKANHLEEDDEVLVVTDEGTFDYKMRPTESSEIERWLGLDRNRIKCVHKGAVIQPREILEQRFSIYDRYDVLETKN